MRYLVVMAELKESSHHVVCKVCAHSIPAPSNEKEDLHCERCGHHEDRSKLKSTRLTMALSLTALIFYIPANLFPFMTIELYGRRNSSTIWGGIVTLAEGGSMAIAIIIFLASIVIPFLKLIILFYLSMSPKTLKRARFKTKLYHFVEAIGRWSMLDIYLLAVLVAIMKLGPWTTVRPEPGALMFALVVIFTMLASAYFDPKLIWRNHGQKIS